MAALCVLSVAACGFDYKYNKIPNHLLILMIAVGIAWQWKDGGLFGIFSYLKGAAIIMVLLYPFFKIGTIGAGEVKLCGVTAGYLPFNKILVFLFVSLLIAAIISLLKMWKRNIFVERMKCLAQYFADVLKDGSWHLYPQRDNDKRHAVGICMSGPVFFSVLLYLGGVY